MSYRIQFKSIEAVGWIPYYKYLVEMPINAFHTFARESKRKWLACDSLFYSGNTPTPEDEFMKKGKNLVELLRSKNYRGALSLRDISLHCHDDGSYTVTYTTLKNKEHVGYTPYRMIGLRSKRVLHFSKGVGAVTLPSVVCRPEGIHLSYEVQFRIGLLGNLAAKLLTGCWAPDVWLHIDYELNRDGQCTINLSGSNIPSGVHYVLDHVDRRTKVYHHDLEKSSLAAIKNIMTLRVAGRANGNYFHSLMETGQIV